MVLAGELLPPGISLDKSTQVPIFVVGCFVQLFFSNQMEESHNKGTGFGTKTRLKVVTPILACRQDREPQKWAQCASCLRREQKRQWVGVCEVTARCSSALISCVATRLPRRCHCPSRSTHPPAPHNRVGKVKKTIVCKYYYHPKSVQTTGQYFGSIVRMVFKLEDSRLEPLFL